MIRITALALAMFFCGTLAHSKAENGTTTMPLDARSKISSKILESSGTGTWTTPMQRAPFEFDELIYSWNVRLPEDQGFRLYLKAGFTSGTETDWLYAGFWGKVKDHVTSRTMPKFDEGIVDMDWLKLKQKADRYRLMVEQASTAPLTVLPSFDIVITDNHAPERVAAAEGNGTSADSATSCILDLPLRAQVDSAGERMGARCQSAALAAAMQYYGTSVPLERIVAHTNDPEYEYPGLWPRVIGAAGEFGFDGYIDRFRDWDRVRAALAENKVILCSIRMAKGECKEPPYDSIGNHIVALNGLTGDGRVVVTDSALVKSGRGYQCQWLMEDFEKIWMKTKNGVAMVICPPTGAEKKQLADLPAFPHGRELIENDDH